MFWKKKKTKNKDSKIILGMVMLNDESSFTPASFIADYNSKYEDKIQELEGDGSTVTFTIDSELVAIGHLAIPIPHGDIEGTAQYAYNWPTALEDLKEYKSHLIVSVMRGSQDPIKRFKIFNHVLCSLLRTTNAVGVYKGNQSLLIPTKDYLSEAALMSDEYLPLDLWIYIGLRASDTGNSVYTYGLKEFDKNEMEIINSSRSIEDIREFLSNIAHYVLYYDVTFKEGQTCGFSEEEKIAITFSKGIYVEGDTFKLAF